MDILQSIDTNVSSMVSSSFDEFISTKVKDAVEKEELSLHGLWTDIGAGGLEAYDTHANRFVPV